MAVMRGVMENLIYIGFLDVILPFLLSTTIAFVMLQKTAVLGKINGQPRMKINLMIAVLVGLIFVSLIQTTTLLSWVLYIVILLVAMTILILVVKLMGVEMGAGWVIALIFTAFFILFTKNYINYDVVLSYIFHPATILFLALGFGIYWIAGGEKKVQKEPEPEAGPEEPGSQGRQPLPAAPGTLGDMTPDQEKRFKDALDLLNRDLI